MLNKMFLCAMCVAASALTGCNAHSLNADNYAENAGDVVTTTVTTGKFHAIHTSGVNVVVNLGSASDKGTLQASERMMEKVKVECRGGVLYAYIKNNRGNKSVHHKLPTLTVSTASLDEIEALVAANVTVNGTLSAKDMELEVTTAGSINISSLKVRDKCELTTTTAGSINIENISAGILETVATTAGTISISGGTVSIADYDATTSGTVDCSNVKAARGSATATTAGTVNCYISGDADCSSTTGGSVHNHAR